MSNKRKVLVTGGAGYIGGHLCRQLLERDYEVVVLDNLLFGNIALADIMDHKNFTFIDGDVRHIGDLAKAVRDVQDVIHLAAIVGDPACAVDKDVTRTVNIESSKSLVELADHYDVERLIFASSCSVYGAAPASLLLNEGSHKNPVSLYAETRILSEDIFKRAKNACVTSLRLATVFGWAWRMRFDLVVNIFTAMATKLGKVELFGGGQYRPFVHCSDAARAFIAALEAPRESVHNEEFNVGSESMNMTIRQLADEVARVLPGTQVFAKEGMDDERNYRVDFSKIRWILKFEPKVSIADGILEMSQRMKDNAYDNWRDDRYHNLKYRYAL